MAHGPWPESPAKMTQHNKEIFVREPVETAWQLTASGLHKGFQTPLAYGMRPLQGLKASASNLQEASRLLRSFLRSLCGTEASYKGAKPPTGSNKVFKSPSKVTGLLHLYVANPPTSSRHLRCTKMGPIWDVLAVWGFLGLYSGVSWEHLGPF